MSGAVIQQTRVIQVDTRGNSFLAHSESERGKACDIDLYTNNIIDFAKDGIVNKSLFLFLTHSTGNLQNMSPAKASGILFNKKLSTDFEKLWEVKTGDIELPHPVVKSDLIYVYGDDNTIHALNTKDGKQKWSFQDANKKHLNFYYKDDKIYAGTTYGKLYILDAKTGSELKELQTDFIMDTPVFVNNDIIYIIESYENKINALNAKNFEKLWTYKTKARIKNHPVVKDGIVYIGSNDWKIYALNEKTGKEKWSYKTNGNVDTQSVVSNGIACVRSLDGNIYTFDALRGDKLWSFNVGASTNSRPLIQDNMVYIGKDNKLYAFDATSGSEVWSFNAEDWIRAAPCYNDGIIYAGSFDHNVYALDAKTGNELWKFQAGDKIYASPSIDVDNDVVYVGSLDGNMYALDAQNGTNLAEFKARDKITGSPAVYEGVVYFMTENEKNYSPVIINGILCSGGYDYRVYALKGKVGMSKIIKEASEASNDITTQQESPKIDIGNEWAVIGDTKVQINK